MKKYLILSLAALAALAACTKTASVADTQNDEISFQVANYATKANVEFTNADFGTYAWHKTDAAEGAQSTTAVFMENEKVAKVGSEWKTVDNTYFWPKTGSVDFISYSPYAKEGGPTVSENTIAWTGYKVAADDLMYADKAPGQTQNVKTYYTEGVPTLFHHALAKLSFKVKANFLEWKHEAEKDEAGNVLVAESTTKWEVTLKSAKLSGIKNIGDLSLPLAADGKTWTLPTTKVWANPTGAAEAIELVTTKDESGALSQTLTTTAADLYDAKSFFVLPQELVAAAQQITLVFHIKTTLANGKIIEEDYNKTLDLKAFSSISSWQMNQNIVYVIKIKPTATTDPKDPDHNDDNPEDVTITFDPALSDWEPVVLDATIQL